MTNIKNRREHLANERTFLAWIRTSIGIMAFGFVVEKFGLFMDQISYFFGKQGVTPPPEGHYSVFGVFLVVFGMLIGLFSFVKYKKIERQIERDTYNSSSTLAVVLTITVVVIGGFLVAY